MFKLLFLILAALGPSLEAFSQALADTVVVLPVAEVEAGAGTVAGARLTVLTPRQIEWEQGATLADLLENQSGLLIRRYGPSGTATIAARGLGAGHTVVLLDGLSITDPQSGVVDFQTLPMVMLESVEIVHGTGDPNQTSGGLGATIRLRTPNPREGINARALGALGAFGEHRAGVRITQGTEQASFLIATEWAEETGDFPFTRRNSAAGEGRRTGADVKSFIGFAKASFRGQKKGISFAGLVTDLERGLPGPANAPPVDSRQWDQAARFWTKANYRTGAWTARLDAALHHANVRYENPRTAIRSDETANSLLARTEVSHIAGRALLQVGLDGRFDRARHTDQGSTEAFANGLLESGSLTLSGGLRMAHWLTDASTETALIPRFGASWKLADLDLLTIRGGVGRAFRAPSVTERFWEPGGNPDLVAERGWNAEIGISSSFGRRTRQRFELTAFHTSLDDRIVWTPAFVGAGVQIWRPFNVGNVVTKGLEARLTSAHTFDNGISANIGFVGAYIEALDRSDRNAASYGHQLRYIPRLTMGLHGEISAGRVSARLGNRLVGKRFITSDESMSESGYGVVDAQIRVSWKMADSRIAMSLIAENILDADYAVIRFYPMPRRHFRARLQYDWN